MTILAVADRILGERCCDSPAEAMLSNVDSQQRSADFQILGHPMRLQILNVLARHTGQVCVCDLEVSMPVKQPTISQHLRLLRKAGLVDSERHGQWAYYFICHEALTALHGRVAGQLATLT